jgi:hypothetical protein
MEGAKVVISRRKVRFVIGYQKKIAGQPTFAAVCLPDLCTRTGKAGIHQ